MFKTNKKGSALALTVIFATVLLQLALVYSYQVRNTTRPTTQIDGRIRLQYLSDGVAQIALLKFQKFPSDYYYAWEFKPTDPGPFNTYTINAPEFRPNAFNSNKDQPSSVISKEDKIDVKLSSMELHNTTEEKVNNKWGEEILTITTEANQNTLSGDNTLTTHSTLTVKTTRSIIE